MAMKKFVQDFKAFALKGNVIDMAVGVIIGAAFGKIVTSLVNDIFMPLISLITGAGNVSGLFVLLGENTTGAPILTVQAAKDAGIATLNYGLFIQTVIDFFLMALCIFLFVKLISNLRKKPEAPAPAPEPRLCPYCKQAVADDATRCPHCTSQLDVVTA
jgi:large conductance mechanosensitive channel